jgi:hypothetical protein
VLGTPSGGDPGSGPKLATAVCQRTPFAGGGSSPVLQPQEPLLMAEGVILDDASAVAGWLLECHS